VAKRLLQSAAVGLLAILIAACAANVTPPAAPAEDKQAGQKPATGTPGEDRLGFATAFERELAKLGHLTTPALTQRYPTPNYLGKLSWDPTTAKFFKELNVEKVMKPGGKSIRRDGTEVVWADTEIPGYKLEAEELATFKKNGFVVSERLGSTSFGKLYYDIYHRDLPVFITSDSVLHAWHRSYDAMFEELEMTYLRHSLNEILTRMHESLPQAHKEYGSGVLKDAVLDADYFLTIARSLLAGGQVHGQIDQVERVKTTLQAIQNEGMHEFRLFGRERNMDFSQFKPRARYEKSPELQQYFRAMMWCGRTDLRISGGYDKTGPLSSPRELGAAMVLLDLLQKSKSEEQWRQFDNLIQTLVGRTDSATFDDLALIAKTAKIATPADLKTEADLTKLADAVEKSNAGKQDIRGDVYIAPSANVGSVLARSFTVMGQKFVIDSWVTSKTVFSDIKWQNQLIQRRVPSGLDVAFAALGNNHVVPELVDRIERGTHRFRDQKPYQHNLAAVRNTLDNLDTKAWDDTIYMQWLKTLRTLSANADEKMPEVMKTKQWTMKQTNTQMASWTQLRHDTLLYVKQSYTDGLTCYYPTGFVEPVVAFWSQMDAMASRSADLLEKTPFPENVKPIQVKQVKFLRNFATTMNKLTVIADKQLNQKELNENDKKLLADVMQIKHVSQGCYSIPMYTGWYPSLFYRGTEDCVKWDALVADVHTNVPAPPLGDPGCVLHQAVGNVDLMIIAIDNGKDRVVYVGPTFSHYEFEMSNAKRMSDSEWKKKLKEGEYPPRPEYTRGYLEPASRPKKLLENFRDE
jgi:hypothetical protein